MPYKALWSVLLLGWVVSYADRTLTGPVIAWMIQNKAGFIGDSANPAALGGLVGSMFFLGYMLTQYPGGRLGDRFGHREMIIVSLLWAAVLTAVSGLVAGLVAFVAARVLTGLGEGVFYSNDRTLIMNHTPVAKRTLGLGVVIAGLSIGLTVGIIATPLLIGWGTSLGMGGEAWRMPFFAFSLFTLVVVAIAFAFFRAKVGGAMKLLPPFLRLVAFSAPTFIVIVALFLLAETLGWPRVADGDRGRGDRAGLHRDHRAQRAAHRAWTGAAQPQHLAGLHRLHRDPVEPVVLQLLVGADRQGVGPEQPAGGRTDRRVQRRSRDPRVPRRRLAGRLGGPHRPQPQDAGPGVHGRLLGARADLRMERLRRREAVARAARLLLFTSGLFFNALQPIVQGMTGDMVPISERGSAFGMLNLISEIGAVASPVVSGVLRDATGSWAAGVYVAAGIMIASFFLYLMVREVPAGSEAPVPT